MLLVGGKNENLSICSYEESIDMKYFLQFSNGK